MTLLGRMYMVVRGGSTWAPGGDALRYGIECYDDTVVLAGIRQSGVAHV